MSKRAPKSNRKRRCESENGPRPAQRKSPRLLANSPSSTKITDLNDDCLLNIFGRLDMGSLFNVAVANEYLRPAAGIVYKQKLNEKTVDITNYRIFFSSEPFVCRDKVFIINLRMVLQYLRCLGSTIDNLSISYSDWNAKQCEHIHQYLNQYCANSLVSIRFKEKQAGNQITHMEKPFVNVRTVEVHNSDLGAEFSSFSEWFPNMRSLTLDWVRVPSSCSIDKPFPHLLDMNIELNNRNHEDDVARNFTTRLLQLCPQLHSLNIRIFTIDGEKVNLKSMLKDIENCQSIRNLLVNMHPRMKPVTLSDVKQLANAHPSLVQLQLYGYRFSVRAVQLLTNQLNSLEQFKFQFGSRSKYADFVSQLDSQWRSSFEGGIIKLEREI